MRNTLYLVLVAVFFTSCAEDDMELDGTIIKVNGGYYKMECRTGNSYVLEPVKYNSGVVVLDGN